MRYRIPLTAGVSLRQYFRGRCLALVSVGVAEEVTLTVYGADVQDGENFGGCGKNFSVFYPDNAFSGVELLAAVDTTVEIIVSNARVETLDGASLTASIAAAQLPLSVKLPGVASVNRSGSLAAGATAQVLMAANPDRRGFMVQNLHASDALWINDQGAATQAQPSIKLPPGAMYETPPGGCPLSAISIIGPTIGQTFSAREW